MENCDVPIHLRDHNYFKTRRTSARHRPSRNCPCCRDIEVQNSTQQPQRSATTSRPPQKSPIPLDLLLRPQGSWIPSRGLCLPFHLPSCHQSPLCYPALSLPLLIPSPPPLLYTLAVLHNHSVEDYQKIYEEVVDDMLRMLSAELRHDFVDVAISIASTPPPTSARKLQLPPPADSGRQLRPDPPLTTSVRNLQPQ
ncbi:uncharacterized protein AKAME5_001291600 [Lates japonicus]|uniref:Uncharacterized protein n=1 Tax=Lates japonicus TaxID=270547 RepID=A0AAD3R9W9_LATJO|nr:uncharacterized protein AKAME5_001291600 [Lates japonicus]